MAKGTNHVYAGLVTTLLRLVFILYAEDRNLLPEDSVYANNYSLNGLYQRLRADDGLYHDTMDLRYGSWAQLLVLFRLVYEGGSHGAMRIPAREGYLFDPDRYLFLEGRSEGNDPPNIPRVSDGVVFRILSKLLVLDGERLSYRTLAVEQIGSVYQAIMGFELRVADSPSIALRAAKAHGAPTTINLAQLLSTPACERLKWLVANTDQKFTGKAVEDLKVAKTIEELLAALDRKIAKEVTPNVVPEGAMIFQPSDERRRSGSHYTPSALTAPIVEAALAPVLRQLGENPTPEQILQMKVCDLAMGSGAFLVEACRQLGDALVKAWHFHDSVPPIPPDEDEVLHARRRVAQRCLYGVDKNPLAADLAKLSLWLATLAMDHPFTFLDHALRAGDSLVGLTRYQIAAFHWLPAQQQSFLEEQLRKRIDHVSEIRQRILAAADDTPYPVLRQKLDQADEALYWMRLAGDGAVAAFFSADKPKTREQSRRKLRDGLETALKNPGKFELAQPIEDAVAALRQGPKGIAPFHWELEFPEVFTADANGKVTGGFDVIVGNPPFLGGKRISTVLGDRYKDYLVSTQEGTSGNMDLAARFFRRAYSMIQNKGAMGLISTNTIAQGDTRRGGLLWIRKNGGSIYRCVRRYKWPGEAAVVVSIVHIYKGAFTGIYYLDGKIVERITAFLFHAGADHDPAILSQNSGLSFIGCDIKGQGFLFDDEDPEATPTAEYHRLVSRCPDNLVVIRPYMSGEEINESPTFSPKRWVINFGERPLDECRRWPDLLAIVESKVRPARIMKGNELADWPWWQFWRPRSELANAIAGKSHMLALSAVNSWVSLARVPTEVVYSHAVVLLALDSYAAFAVLQSRVHELWARFFGSSMKDDLRYTPSDCFETFPFPKGYEQSQSLCDEGPRYYMDRSTIMKERSEGMTAVYNRFHDPEECDLVILGLRERHAELDRKVLDSYGWSDIQPTSEFLLDYEEDEDKGDNGPRRRKRPWRYRWPDEIRDEVLARLLDLNRQRAIEEGQVPAKASAPAESDDGTEAARTRNQKRVSSPAIASQSALFGKPKGVA